VHSLAALAAVIGLPVGAVALALRPRWRTGLPERLGRAPRGGPGAVWVHAASVGESLAALALIDGLRARGHAVFASVMTVVARDLLRRRAPELACALAPLDHPWCVETALARVRPSLLILVETELWPTWIAAAHRRGVPVMVASGRMSDRSFARYGRVRSLLAPTLARLDRVAARTGSDAERFVALGAAPDRVVVSGDLKLAAPSREAPLAPDLATVLGVGPGDPPLLVAGSTHPGEEAAVLEAFAACRRTGGRAGLVVAPRHLERVGEVAALLRAQGLVPRLRSTLAPRPLADGEVLLLDSFGELPAVYTRATGAFVGGSLAPVGGHNLLEPIRCGCPVVHGPQIANVADTAAWLDGEGAARCIADAAELGRAWRELLADPEPGRARAARVRDELAPHVGSLERTLAVAESLVARRAAGAGPL